MTDAAYSIGKEAPTFELLNQDGAPVALEQFRGSKNVLIYFYPRAFTPGCTKQACGIRNSAAGFAANNTVVLGISGDPVDRLKRFQQKHGLDFDLLSDPDHEVSEKYGTWGKRSFIGKFFFGVARSSFIVDADGVLRHVIPKAKPASHDSDALDWIEAHLTAGTRKDS